MLLLNFLPSGKLWMQNWGINRLILDRLESLLIECFFAWIAQFAAMYRQARGEFTSFNGAKNKETFYTCKWMINKRVNFQSHQPTSNLKFQPCFFYVCFCCLFVFFCFLNQGTKREKGWNKTRKGWVGSLPCSRILSLERDRGRSGRTNRWRGSRKKRGRQEEKASLPSPDEKQRGLWGVRDNRENRKEE